MAKREIDKELSLQELAQGFDASSLKGMTIQQLRPKISMIAYKTRKSHGIPMVMKLDPDNCLQSTMKMALL